MIISLDRLPGPYLDTRSVLPCRIFTFEGDSKVYWFEGGFSDYEENYKKRVGDIVPQRLKYKKLVRG